MTCTNWKLLGALMSDLLILFLFLGPLLEAGSVGSGMLDNGADRGGGGAA